MNQVLNIFRKDTRRFWPEIAISIVLAFAFAAAYPNEWKTFHDPNDRQRMLLITGALGFLMVMSWWLLIARVVHAETLVGDRQFWITRPYEWQKLLAAKALFIVAWIGLPYLLAEFVMLGESGFSPLPYTPGLLLNLLLMGIAFLLPLFAVATVTANFARLTLTLLGCMAIFIGYMFLINGIPRGYVSSNPYPNHLLYPLLFLGCAVAIALEYATRRVWVSRTLLIVLPFLLALTVAANRRQSLVDQACPPPGAAAAAPFNATVAPRPNHPIQARSYEGQDYIDLPLHFSGVADGYVVVTADYKFTLIAADGSQWTSPWQRTRDHIRSDGADGGISLELAPALYDRFKSGPVTLQVSYALDHDQVDATTTIPFPTGQAAVPGLGLCIPESGFMDDLVCRSAMRDPGLTLVSTVWSSAPCTAPPGATRPGEGWHDSDSTDFVMSPVWIYRMFFGMRGGDQESWHMCPGSPLTVTQYRLLDRTQASFTFPNFVLPAYVEPT